MLLEYEDSIEVLEQKLEKLPSQHRLAFCAAIAQRMLPAYNTYAQEEGLEDTKILITVLDEIWQILAGKIPNYIYIKQLFESCDKIYPDMDDSTCPWCLEAQMAVATILDTLRCVLEQTPRAAARVPDRIHNTLYMHLDLDTDAIEGDCQFTSLQEQIKKVINHPLTKKEMKKENDDFSYLLKAEILDKERLDWLRISSSHDNSKILVLS